MANRFLNNIKINDQYTFPPNDGSAGQAIVTDGLGNLSFGSTVASSAESAEATHILVKNTSGAPIAKGTPVYVTGETGNSGKIEIAPADASDEDKMPALGLLETTLNDNAEGYCVQGGLLEALATATIDGTSTTANDTVYIKAGGGLTMTKPTGSNFIQNIAKVARVHASNGSLVVSSILRTNDVPTPLYIDHDNQRLGIGITSPQTTLHMGVQAANPTRTEEFRLESRGGSGFGGNSIVNLYTGQYGTSGVYFGDVSTYSSQPARVEFVDVDSALNYDSTRYHNWKVLGSTKMTLKNDFLGIGITNPLVPLHISSTEVDTDFLIACNSTQARMSINNTGTGDPQINFQLSNSSKFTIGVDNSDSDKFKISAGSSLGSSDRIVVDSSGNVGIGTTILSQKLHVSGNARVTGAYYDSNNSPGTLGQVLSSTVTGTDWVDASSGGGGTVTGTGTTNTLPIWSDGPNGVLGNSQITDDGTDINISSSRNFNATRNFGVNEFNAKIDVGSGLNAGLVALDVRQKAYVRSGMVISPNPTNVQVDDSSLVVGAGNNDIVAGSDHCLTVGSGNQILDDSDRSVSFGNNNETKSSDNSINVGNTNILKYSNNSHIIGQDNQMGDEYTSNTSGFNNSLIIGSDNLLLTDDGSTTPSSGSLSFVIGHGNELRHTLQNSFSFGYSISNLGLASTSHRNDFNIGGDLVGVSQTMTLGYRNNTSSYPATDYSLGLGNTKFALAVGSATTTNSNALLITEGGVNRGNNVAQVPRVLLPTVTGFSASNDAAADALGVPQGALYQNQGVVQINRGGGSTTDPLAGNGGTSGVGGSGTLNYVAKFTPNGNAIGNSLIYDNGTSVGIGDTNPDAKLTVFRTESTYAVNLSDTESRAGLSVKSSSNFDSKLTISSGGSSRQYIQAVNNAATTGRDIAINPYGGNVGIGTTSPAAKLEVEGSDHLFQISTSSSTGNPYMSFNQAGTRRSFIQHNNSGDYLKLASEYGGISFFTGTAGGETQKMTILSGGNVGINSTNPHQKLTIRGNDNYVATEQTSYAWGGTNTIGVRMGTSTAGLLDFRRWDGGVTHGTAVITQVTSDGGWGLDFRVDNKSTNTAATTSRMFLSTSGEVGIGDTTPSYKLDVNGTIRATGDVIAYSDIRVKENIKTIDNAVNKVKALRGVEYNKIDSTEKSIGVIAQEIEEVIPEVVREDDQGMKSVAYGNITAVLIEAIKEQQNQIDELKNQLNAFTK
jgi:hypothetical protein